MRAEESASKSSGIRVLGVIDFNESPGVPGRDLIEGTELISALFEETTDASNERRRRKGRDETRV